MTVCRVLALASLMTFAHAARAGDLSVAMSDRPVRFDRTFLSTHDRADVSLFEYGNFFPAGERRVDIEADGRRIGAFDVTFVAPGTQQTTPCFPKEVFRRLGLRDEILSEIEALPRACLTSAELPPLIDFESDFSQQRIIFKIPQSVRKDIPPGYTDPASWSRGIDAGFVTYHLNLSRIAGASGTNSAFLGLTEGANIGGWNLRGHSIYSTRQGSGPEFIQQDAYLARDIDLFKGRVYAGKYLTDGRLFPIVGVDGVSLRSDDLMLPESMRGFAPVVRGIARSNAQVTVSQGGRIVTQQNVPPGPFELQHLFGVSTSEPLHVVVLEADGSTTAFDIASPVVPRLLRRGTFQYGFTVGRLDDSLVATHPAIAEGAALFGLSGDLTAYAGVQMSDIYRALVTGVAISTPLGALSVDDMLTQSRVGGSTAYGTAWHAAYSAYAPWTRTSVSASYDWYGSQGLFDVRQAEVAAHRSGVVGLLSTDTYNVLAPMRSRWQVGLTQNIPGHGSIYATVFAQTLRNSGGPRLSYQLSYNDRIGRIGYAVGLSRMYSPVIRSSYNLASVSMTVPLGQRATANAQVLNSGQGSQQSMGVTGQLDAGRVSGSYGLSLSHSAAGAVAYGNAAAALPVANVSAYLSDGGGYMQQAANITGSVIGFGEGIEASAPVDDTFALVRARAVPGAQVPSAANTYVGKNGLAVIPYLQPYSENLVTIDPQGTAANVELQETQKTVIPRSGSIQLVDFAAEPGHPVFVRFRGGKDGSVPFGAAVYAQGDQRVGLVGSDSVAYVRIEATNGQFLVRDESGLICIAPYSVNAPDAAASQFSHITVDCRKP